MENGYLTRDAKLEIGFGVFNPTNHPRFGNVDVIAGNSGKGEVLMRLIGARWLALLLVVFCAMALAEKSGTGAGASKESVALEHRIDGLIVRMTLEEKVRMGFGGTEPGVVILPSVERLGIPPIYPVDGPRGVTAVHW